MNLTVALEKLRSMGSAHTRKVYVRHGITGDVFGVSYADLGKLRKEIGADHALARGLWKSGNHDARVLAMMVGDPEAVTVKEAEGWAKQCDNYPIADAFAGLVARSPHAKKLVQKWTKAKAEFIGAAGWHVLAICCGGDDAPFTDTQLGDYVARIEKGIHSAPNRTRYAMNTALIAIGGRGGGLQKKAVGAAKRIGKVEVDHGDTSCKTPDAASYIAKIAARRAGKRTAKKAAKKKTAKKKVVRKTARKRTPARKDAKRAPARSRG